MVFPFVGPADSHAADHARWARLPLDRAGAGPGRVARSLGMCQSDKSYRFSAHLVILAPMAQRPPPCRPSETGAERLEEALSMGTGCNFPGPRSKPRPTAYSPVHGRRPSFHLGQLPQLPPAGT